MVRFYNVSQPTYRVSSRTIARRISAHLSATLQAGPDDDQETIDMSGLARNKKTLPIDQLILVFRNCLLALTPHMDEVGIPWRDKDAYDDWDRIEGSLFTSIVSTPITFTFTEGQRFGLPAYNSGYNDPSLYSILFDEVLGSGLRFLTLEQKVLPFDTSRFIPVANIGSDQRGAISKPLTMTQFVVSLRSRAGTEMCISRIVNIE